MKIQLSMNLHTNLRWKVLVDMQKVTNTNTKQVAYLQASSKIFMDI